MTNKQRFVGLDSLRIMMVILVIALHAGMTYMDYRPDWWYVLDNSTSLGFTILVVVIDTFPMTVLFFLSGYFAPPSYAKRGRAEFLKDKFMHIGIPWLLGVLFVAPFFSRATFIALGYPSMPIHTYFTTYFFSPLYQQAHYWFLGILLFFFLCYAFMPKNIINGVTTKALRPSLCIMLLIALTFLTYYLSSAYYKPCGEWTNVCYLLYFQPARIVGYMAMFAFGVYANRQGWFKPGGWRPSLVYLFIAIASLLLLVYWKFTLASTLSAGVSLCIDALSYAVISVCITFGLIALFIKEPADHKYSLSKYAPYSYGIYWLHQIVLLLFMDWLMRFDIPAIAKWSISMVVTLVVCTLLAKYVLKKAPLLKRIF